MSFLSIAFLAALPLAAAPILLHLFDRRRDVVIQWGAMQFLIDASTQQTKARRLKQWLLVALRTLAIAALVFALARPMLPGSWFGSSSHTETIFILDNSMSMTRSVGDRTLFEHAVDQTLARIEETETGDAVRVLLASPYPVWATTGSVRMDDASRSTVRDLVRSSRPTDGRSDLLSALFTAIQTELEPTQQARRIVVLADGQAVDWDLKDDAGWLRLNSVLQSARAATDIEMVRIDEKAGRSEGSSRSDVSAQNIALNEIHSNRAVVGVDQTFSVTAVAENLGNANSQSCQATWAVGDETLHVSEISSLAAGEKQNLLWKHSFDEPGVYRISCEHDAKDVLEADNSATLVIQVVEQVPVVVVDDESERAEMQQDSFFVQTALGWIDGQPLDQRSVHVPTIVKSSELTQLELSDQRAVVIPNYRTLDRETVEQLHDFVYSGGGLWIALGPRSDIESFNNLLFSGANGLAPLAVSGLVETSTEPEDGAQPHRTTIETHDDSHPATQEFVGNGQLDLNEVAVSSRFEFVPPPSDGQISVLLRLDDGQPLAVEKYVGRGRVIVQSIPLRLQWSDLARSQAFVVMMQNWLDYLTQPLATRHNLKPGDPIAVRLPDSDSKHAVLTTPDGDEIDLTAEPVDGGVEFRSSRTIAPGDYSMQWGFSGDEVPFHVQRDPTESDLTALSKSDVKRLADFVKQEVDPEIVQQSAAMHSEAVWPLLLFGLIAVIAAELLLSGIISAERFGAESIKETNDASELSETFVRTAQSRVSGLTTPTSFQPGSHLRAAQAASLEGNRSMAQNPHPADPIASHKPMSIK